MGGIAQLVEQRNHNPFVPGSSPGAANLNVSKHLRKWSKLVINATELSRREGASLLNERELF